MIEMDFNKRSNGYTDNLDFAHLLIDAESANKRIADQKMTDTTDYRHELALRDDQLRREMDLRQESFRAEQTVRDKSMDERFSGFLAAQSERDKAWEKISDARFERIEKDVASIKSDAKKITDDVHGIRRWIATYTGGIAVIAVIFGAVIKHFWA
jgi:hypothetical protein